LVPIWLNERIRFNYRSAVIYSDDGGQSWHAGGIVGLDVPDTNECMAVERSDNSLLLSMRAQGSRRRAVSVSKDGGVSWAAPALDDSLIDPVCQASILRVERGARAVLLFANPASTKRENLTIRISHDDGRTWPRAESIWSGPSGYSDLAFSRGSVFCLHEAGDTRYAERIRCVRLDLAELLNR
jgi:sialidase-1